MPCKPSPRGQQPGQGRRGGRGPAGWVFWGGCQHLGRAGKGFQAVHGKLCNQTPHLQGFLRKGSQCVGAGGSHVERAEV